MPKIRFNMTIPTGYFCFHMGQVIDVPVLTAEMQEWIKPLPDGTVRAELVREEETELAVVGATERAVTRRGRPRRKA